MNRKVLVKMGIVLIVAQLIILLGCISENKFVNDPVKWSYVSGDGSWNENSRIWTVYLSPGETKSIIIRLYNSSSQLVVVNIDARTHTDQLYVSLPKKLSIPASGSVDNTFTMTAKPTAPSGSHGYVLILSNSFNSSEDVP